LFGTVLIVPNNSRARTAVDTSERAEPGARATARASRLRIPAPASTDSSAASASPCA